jgi:hypothetical protein
MSSTTQRRVKTSPNSTPDGNAVESDRSTPRSSTSCVSMGTPSIEHTFDMCRLGEVARHHAEMTVAARLAESVVASSGHRFRLKR